MKKIIFSVLFLFLLPTYVFSDVLAPPEEEDLGVMFLTEGLASVESSISTNSTFLLWGGIAGLVYNNSNMKDNDSAWGLESALEGRLYPFNSEMRNFFIGAYVGVSLVKKTYIYYTYTTNAIWEEETKNWHLGMASGIKIGYKFIPLTFNNNKTRILLEPYCSVSLTSFRENDIYGHRYLYGTWLSFGIRTVFEFPIF